MSLVSSKDTPVAASTPQRISIRFVPAFPISIPVKQMAGSRTGLTGSGSLPATAKRMTFLALQPRLARRTARIIVEEKESAPKAVPPAGSLNQPTWRAKGRS